MRRSSLPSMTLCNGCGDCCGPAAARPDEINLIRHYMRENHVEWVIDSAKPLQCGFLRAEGDRFVCGIYAVRPWVCRAFGVVAELACGHFPEAVVLSLPPEEAMMRRLSDPDDQLLGEAFETGYFKRLQTTAERMKLGRR